MSESPASTPISSHPIGVFDSGYGGLSVLRELRRVLPSEDYIYLGDSGRAPYGGRDLATVLDFAEQCVALLFAEGCRLVVVACHTVSCVALRHLQQLYADTDHRILGVTIPAAENAVGVSKGGHIGFLGTRRTVSSHTFRTEVAKLDAQVKVTEVAAPLLAPIVEEGWEDSEIARLSVEQYLAQVGKVDTLVLGCTHYPLLRGVFQQCLPEDVHLLDPAPFLAKRLVDWFERHPEFHSHGTGKLRVLSSGDTVRFAKNATRFLGSAPPPIEYVAERNGRLVFSPEGEEPMGQFVRTV